MHTVVIQLQNMLGDVLVRWSYSDMHLPQYNNYCLLLVLSFMVFELISNAYLLWVPLYYTSTVMVAFPPSHSDSMLDGICDFLIVVIFLQIYINNKACASMYHNRMRSKNIFWLLGFPHAMIQNVVIFCMCMDVHMTLFSRWCNGCCM